MTKCDKCYQKVDGEHRIVPIRDLSFLILNLEGAFMLLESHGHEFSKKEKATMKKLWDKYTPIIHYWSVGQFYDMPENEYNKFEYRHKSYM